MSVHFLYFYLNEKKLNQQVYLITYVENEICNSTSHKKERAREQKHNPTSKTFLKLLKKFSLVTLVTNYHKLSLSPLVVKIWKTKVGVKFWILLLLLQSYIFIASAKDLNVLQISKTKLNLTKELNFCH